MVSSRRHPHADGRDDIGRSSAPARATYGGLLRHGEFRALFLAQVVSMLGTMVAEVALTVLIFQRTGRRLCQP